MKTCDRVITVGIVVLLFFTPMAFGSVHPWAYSSAEFLIFVLTIVWMSRLLFGPAVAAPIPARVTAFVATPLILLPLVALIQMTPLPPGLLKALSPSTYGLYARTLPGWPRSQPYADAATETSAPSLEPARAVLPTEGEAYSGAKVPFADALKETDAAKSASAVKTTEQNAGSSTGFEGGDSIWRPLSIAPSLTDNQFQKISAYACLFLLVLLYPLEGRSSSDASEQFVRRMTKLALLAGFAIAMVGLLERFTWNGKILWFFVPYDWGLPRPSETPHASGPFINYDHFANYLALVFPIATMAALFPKTMSARESGRSYQVFGMLALFVIFLGILLSQSRAGWIGAGVGTAVLVGGLLLLPRDKRPGLFKRSRLQIFAMAGGGFALLIFVSLLFVGSPNRSELDERLGQTGKTEVSLNTRLNLWRDSSLMVRDFPLLGIGLGAWPDLFQHYRRPPWSLISFREAHNDYLQLLTETGVVGAGILVWFVVASAVILSRARSQVSHRSRPLYAALLAALAVMAFHEFFDFSLQIPANAILFVLLFAGALRLALGANREGEDVPVRNHRVLAPAVILVVGYLLIRCFNHESLPYPYDLTVPQAPAAAARLILAHPAVAGGHLYMYRLTHNSSPADRSIGELETAVWLNPSDPVARDFYASALLKQGKTQAGYQQLSTAVESAPALWVHPYLEAKVIPWLTNSEKSAVETGFQRASSADYPGALEEFGKYYGILSRFPEQAEIYQRAANREADPKKKLGYLLFGGLAYNQVGDSAKAEKLLREAVNTDPADPRPYCELARSIFGPRRDLKSASTVIEQGVNAGADPAALYMALSEAAENAGDDRESVAALAKAVEAVPNSFEANFKLGALYLKQKSFERAALSLTRATELDPNSVWAFFYLGAAEEGRYRLTDAGKAYTRASDLAPANPLFKKFRDNVRTKIGGLTS